LRVFCYCGILIFMFDLEIQESGNKPEECESALCIRCCQPVSQEVYYCPHCGHVVNSLTPYLPYQNIPFFVDAVSAGNRRLPSWVKWTALAGVLLTFGPLLPLVAAGILVGYVLRSWFQKAG